ncbi:MAG TPA: hypothetical protein DIW44_07490 [Anaerolineaceae bacterium]|nr:hypothetical protein [Anaerolineaceae bacterium]
MDINPNEAQESLQAIQHIMIKTKRMIASSGAYKFLFLWGVIWLVGFLATQFIQGAAAGYIWLGLDTIGGFSSAFIGIRMGRTVRNESNPSGIRIGAFWWSLMAICGLTILVVWPIDWKQFSMMIILFVMTGWIATGLLFKAVSVWLGIGIIALAFVGYYLLPNYFFLWMSILGGGGMIAAGFYVRSRW